MLDTGVNDVDHALGAHLEYQIRMLVEVFGTVDEGQMMHGIDAFHGPLDEVAGTYIADHQFHIAGHLAQAPLRAARIVVEDAHAMTALQQAQYQSRPYESGSASDEISFRC